MADLRSILDRAPVDKTVKADAWDHFEAAATPEDFQSRFDKLPLPKEVKAELWDAKFGTSDVSLPSTPPTPSASAPAATAPAAPAMDPKNPEWPEGTPQWMSRKQTGDFFTDTLQLWTDINIMGRVPQMVQQGVSNAAEFLVENAKLGIAPGSPIPPALPQDTAVGTKGYQAQAAKTQETYDKPLLPLTALTETAPGTKRTAKEGLAHGVAGFAEGLTTPKNLAIVAATGGAGAEVKTVGSAAVRAGYELLDAGLSAYFTYEMAHGAKDSAVAGYDAWQKGDYAAVAEHFGLGSLSALAAALTGTHTAGKVRDLGKEPLRLGRLQRDMQDAANQREARRRAEEEATQQGAPKLTPGTDVVGPVAPVAGTPPPGKPKVQVRKKAKPSAAPVEPVVAQPGPIESVQPAEELPASAPVAEVAPADLNAQPAQTAAQEPIQDPHASEASAPAEETATKIAVRDNGDDTYTVDVHKDGELVDTDTVSASDPEAAIDAAAALGQQHDVDPSFIEVTPIEGVANDNETELPAADEAVQPEAAPVEEEVTSDQPSAISTQPAAPEKKPVTPQLAEVPGGGTKYVLPGFVTDPHKKPKAVKGETQKSDRFVNVRAAVDGDTITVTIKNRKPDSEEPEVFGGKPVHTVTVSRAEWEAAEKHPNPNYPKAQLVRKALDVDGHEDPASGSRAERIASSAVQAIESALKSGSKPTGGQPSGPVPHGPTTGEPVASSPAPEEGQVELPESTSTTAAPEKAHTVSANEPEPAIRTAEPDPGTQPDGAGDPRPLAEVPSEDVQPDVTSGSEESRVRGAGADARSDVRPGSEAEDASGPGEGDGVSAVVSSPERGGSAGTRIRPADTPRGASRDYRIADPAQIGVGGVKEKARKNIAAIRLMKQLEDAGRSATPEEQAALASYVGWGGAAQAFDYYNRDWAGVREELQGALTPEEFESARATTPNAHYTSPAVISGMWRAMARLGMKPGARVLEPSMGVGHFFGLMPEELAAGGKRTGVEIDSLTARIAKQLYPDSDIRHQPFEQASIPNNFYDFSIGNVPFGNYGVTDRAYRKAPKFVTSAIHNYFFAKALDKTRPGGIVAFITSSYTLDGQNHRAFREYIADRADLVGAIRLPNTTFKGNAGTEVTTDIIFLQKREPQTARQGETWAELGEVTGKDAKPYRVNEYYVRHPEMMLGTMEPGKMYADSQMLGGEFTPELLASAIARLPENVVKAWEGGSTQANTRPLAELPDAGTIKNHAYGVKDGKVIVRRDDSYEDANLSAEAAKRVVGMIGVRDALREVYRTQLDGAGDEAIVAARKRLNTAYDTFVKRHGYLSAKPNYRAFDGDPDHPLLLSLENWDDETEIASKAPIFEKRTLERAKPVEKTDTAAEALTVTLNEIGRIDWARMQELTGKTPDELREELGTLVYKDPEGAWEPADEYLSGNVRAKLALAEAAAKADSSYARNVEALKAVQPADLEPEQIDARLGSTWIPAATVTQWARQLLSIGRDLSVSYAAPLAQWKVAVKSGGTVANTKTYGNNYFSATDLIEMAMNGKIPVAYDTVDEKRVQNKDATLDAQEKLSQLQENFSKWVWEDPDRATALARKYNDEFNNLRLWTANGSHLTFPGMARLSLRGGDLDPHQKNAVWRIIRGGNALLAHVVGAGKTFEMVAAAMEMRRLGLAKKPMFAVPNHLVGQTGAEFLRLYPNANLFIADQEHFASGKRQLAMARIANGNYDAVIVAHSSFGLIPVSDQTHNDWIAEQIAELESAMEEARADGDKISVKELEKAKKRLDAKLRDKTDQEGKDQALEFEQLGVDALFVDEAHLFKNLFFVTKRTRVAGIPATESDRATDMFLKTNYLSRLNNGKGVVFATGTPISNSMVEMYTMQRYLQMNYLRATGMAHFDNWANNYGQAVTALELAPDGSGYRMNTRFAKFVNLPELLNAFRMMADVQTAEMLNLPRPKLKGGGPSTVAAPATPALKAFVATLVKRAEAIKTGRVDPSRDNMLLVTSHGRWAALDMRMVDPNAPDNPDSKLNQAVNKIHRIWKDSAAEKSAQLVFLDFSLSMKGKKPGKGALTDFSAYDDMRAKLIKMGVPAKEIVFIHEAKNDADRLKLFAAVNAGKVRILFGSTPKMGAGTNVQKKLIAEHHLDAPWRPSDIEQREGRILRQGNSNAEVQIYRYVTEESFDAYMWQTLETKAKFISQVMTGETSVRSAEDIDGGALTYAEVKAIASGNPMVMEKHKVDLEVRKLDSLKTAHEKAQRESRYEIGNLPQGIAQLKENIERYNTDIAHRDASEKAFTIGKKTFTGDDARKEAGEALHKILENVRADREPFRLGSYYGFELFSKPARFTVEGHYDLPNVTIHGEWMYTASANEDNPLGTIQSIEYQIRSLENGRDAQELSLQRSEQRLTELQAEASKPFPKEEQLKAALAKQKELNKALDLGKSDNQAAAAADETPSAPGLGDLLADESGTFNPAALQEVAKPAVDFFRPVSSRIRSEGAAGKRVMDLIEKAHDTGEVRGGQKVVELVDAGLPKLTRDEAFNLVDVLEGRLPSMNQKVRVAADAARDLLDEQGDEAINLGVQVKVREFLYPNQPIPQGLNLNAFQLAARNAGKRVRVSYSRPFAKRSNYYPHSIPAPAKLKRGLAKDSQVRKDVIDNLVRRGVRPNKTTAAQFIDDYVTFMESGKRTQSLIDYMVRSGQARTEADAFEMLRNMRESVKAKAHRSLEFSREANLPFWDPDARRVLPSMLASGAIRLSEIEHLGGQKHPKIKGHLNAIRKAGGNADWVDQQLNKILGLDTETDKDLEKLSAYIRNMQGYRLGMAVIANATQPLNVLLATDTASFIGGIKAAFSADGRRFGIESGATLESILLETQRNAGASGEGLSKFLRWTGFSGTERNNRVIAANAGAIYAKRLLPRARLGDRRARRKLAELGIDVQAAMSNGLTADDVMMAAKKLSDFTQFRARVEDLPAFSSNPIGKLVLQFQSFTYGQTRLLHREIFEEFKAKKFGRGMRALLILGTLYPLTGELINQLKDWLTGNDSNDDDGPLARYWRALSSAASLGVISNLVDSSRYQRGVEMLVGPTFSDIGKLMAIPAKADPLEALEKFILTHLPFGQMLNRRVFPKERGVSMDPELKKLMGGGGDDIVDQVLKGTGTR